jgi:hypothetical protein
VTLAPALSSRERGSERHHKRKDDYMNVPAVTVPELEHDAMMLREFGHTVSDRGRMERRIVAALLAHLSARGFEPRSVWDGEEDTPATDTKAVMELVFNLDESRVYFGSHSVVFILGNGVDVLSDWTYSKGDADGFDAAMQAFSSEAYAPPRKPR